LTIATVTPATTRPDHVWHTFHALRLAEFDEVDGAAFDTLENFIARIGAILQWNEQLSAHWGV